MLSVGPRADSAARPSSCRRTSPQQAEAAQPDVRVGADELEIADRAPCVQWRWVLWALLPCASMLKWRAYGFRLQIGPVHVTYLSSGRQATEVADGGMSVWLVWGAEKSPCAGKSNWLSLWEHCLYALGLGNRGPVLGPGHSGAQSGPASLCPPPGARVPVLSLPDRHQVLTPQSHAPTPGASNSPPRWVQTPALGLSFPHHTILHVCASMGSRGDPRVTVLGEQTEPGLRTKVSRLTCRGSLVGRGGVR